MRPQIFFDIDTQVDFMQLDGRLYVPGAESIRRNLAGLSAYAACHPAVRIFASCDAHDLQDPEFAQFPPHCIKGTLGQQKIPETIIPGGMTGIPSHSLLSQNVVEALREKKGLIFEKQAFDLFSNPNADLILSHEACRDAVVYGVATDYCVKAAVTGLLDRGYRVRLVEDAIRPVNPESGQQAVQAMVARGAQLIKTAEIIGATSAEELAGGDD
ncbi:MAG: cysteine hydrolase family protein [Acidobacteria bacterium]|nr:cysteine hydrolase family protein [Acidobacteriota bacterium]